MLTAGHVAQHGRVFSQKLGDRNPVHGGDLVRIRFPGERAVVLENVQIRVARNAALELHLDTDDANAADVRAPMTVEILR